MPLRDHFQPPVSGRVSRMEIHGMWAGEIAKELIRTLPPEYLSGVQIHLGAFMEVDVATLEQDSLDSFESNDEYGLKYQPDSPTLLLDADEMIPAEYEVRVYEVSTARRLVAAIELVSPSIKDRESSRDAFVSKCHALQQQNVNVIIVDTVTNSSTNLYADLADRLGANPPAIAASSICAVSLRTRSATVAPVSKLGTTS